MKGLLFGIYITLLWSDFGFFFSLKCVKWVKQSGDGAVGRANLTRREL